MELLAFASGPDIAVPAGIVSDFAGAAAPTGWLLCDGSLVLQATYPALFTAIGHTYNGGVDPGGGQFRLPDGRGRGTVGKGTHVDVDALGDSDAIALASRTPNHTHGPGNLGGTTGQPSANQSAATPVLGSVPSVTHTHPFTVTTGATGSSPGGGYLVLNKVIKT